jgi:GNAT superfamily N-acetyltransferase
MTQISIRCSETGDNATVAQFIHALPNERSGGASPSIEDTTRITCAILSEASVFAALAYADDKPVGVMTLNECAAIYAGGKFGEISELYVRPNMTSQGVAQRLLQYARNEGRSRGWKRIEVGAPGQPDWIRTLDFYLRNDFEEVGPRPRSLI